MSCHIWTYSTCMVESGKSWVLGPPGLQSEVVFKTNKSVIQCISFLKKLNKMTSSKHTGWSRDSSHDPLGRMISTLGELLVSGSSLHVALRYEWESGSCKVGIPFPRGCYISSYSLSAITRYCWLGDSHHRHLFSHCSEGWKSQISVPV